MLLMLATPRVSPIPAQYHAFTRCLLLSHCLQTMLMLRLEPLLTRFGHSEGSDPAIVAMQRNGGRAEVHASAVDVEEDRAAPLDHDVILLRRRDLQWIAHPVGRLAELSAVLFVGGMQLVSMLCQVSAVALSVLGRP